MNLKPLLGRLAVVALTSTPFFLYKSMPETDGPKFIAGLQHINTAGEEKDEEEEAEYSQKRLLHEYKMLRNPATGRIPQNYRKLELEAAKKIPARNIDRLPWLSGIAGTEGVTNQNNYVSVGPNNVAGRSRTLEFDRRNPQIMITGGTDGGIFRSTDGGQSWQFVSSEDDIRSATSIVQNPSRPDEWYCGTGEVFYPASKADIAGTVGYGIFKSTNNGVSWTKLSATTQGSQHRFDNNFDFVHRLAVHPVTGHVYAAVHNRIMRSTDGGQSWQTVLRSDTASNALEGITEVYIPTNGSKIYAAFSGENRDRNIVGVWESVTGDPQGTGNAWKRIAGGQQGQPDSVPGWRPYPQWGRIVLTTNNANNRLFVLYKNGLSAENGQPEADLFRANIATTLPSGSAWTNLSAWVPDEPDFDEPGIDPYTTQFNGFNMSIKVKPDNDNIVFIGGTNIHRVHLNETDPAKKFRRIGGYGKGFFPNDFFYPNHHPDVHWITYWPGTTNTLVTASDGGIHKTTTSDMADTVRWQPLVTDLQTVQYQFVSIIPDVEYNMVIGGTQDNGTLANLNAPADKDHIQIGSGDGASVAFSDFTKTGNTWRQTWYFTISGGAMYRSNFTWEIRNNTLEYVNNTITKITPGGLDDDGPWLTLFLMDPDSTGHLYYTHENRMYRTLRAPSVTSSSGWTEMSGTRTTIPSNHTISAMAISKLPASSKYLFLGTDGGRLYRLDSSDKAGPAKRPVNITPPTMANGSYVAGIAVNPRNPDTVLVVVSNYDDNNNTVHNIFWSGNATRANPTWQTLCGDLEPVSAQSCAIVVKTTGVEYYVGTSVGLYSTTSINGDNTQWVREGTGMMKTAIVRSLYNRHEDNTLVVGTHGNGAFYTEIGNAISYDGDSIPDPGNGTGFISAVFPTITRTQPVNYQIGNANVSRIRVDLFNALGQLVYRQDKGYESGSVPVNRLPAGVYFLRIISADGKYKFVQKIVKQ